MEADNALRQAYDEVLRKIGRNLLLFEQAELLVRKLMEIGTLSARPGTVSEGLQNRTEVFRKLSMGQLINAFVDGHCKDGKGAVPDRYESTEADPNGDRLAIHFTFGSSGRPEDTRRVTLAAMVAGRQELVHHLLARINRDSLESCIDAEKFLDEQRRGILPEIHHLQQALKAVRKDLQAILDHLNHPAGMEELFLLEIQQNPLIRNLVTIATEIPGPEGWVRLGEAINLLQDFPPGKIKALLNQFGRDSLTDFLVASEYFEIHLERTENGHHRVFYRLKRAPNSLTDTPTAL